jgi:hypothetical protein
MEDRLPAEVGMKWRHTHYASGDKLPKDRIGSEQVVVGPACGNSGKGYWVCIEHGMLFLGWEKDQHFDGKPRKKPCHLAWCCAEHETLTLEAP